MSNKIDNFLIRPVMYQDLDAVYELASQTGPGMTSLPADRKILETKIQESINSFSIEPTKPGNEAYRFVLEYQNKIIGIAAIRAKVGGYEPFYSYEICFARHQNKELKVDIEVPYLKLCKEYDGPSIISSLFLLPEYRSQGLGKYLSQARFLFMADFARRFSETVIAEMRGYINAEDKSPFWEGTVRNFFDMDFAQADYLSAKDKGFIADLMPQYPIYIPLLRDDVVKSIGQVHDKTLPALQFLESEGFKRDGHVDIFDAGPRIQSKISEIRTVKKSRRTRVQIFEDLVSPKSCLISNAKLDYKVTLALAGFNGDKLYIKTETAKLLALSEGEELRYIEV